MATSDTLRQTLVDSLAGLAAAREYLMSTVEIPAPRPESDYCPGCGGTDPEWPMRVPGGARCTTGHHAR